jgi:hypothetical protein
MIGPVSISRVAKSLETDRTDVLAPECTYAAPHGTRTDGARDSRFATAFQA